MNVHRAQGKIGEYGVLGILVQKKHLLTRIASGSACGR